MRPVDLRLNPYPVNRDAVRVAFYAGEHFSAPARARSRRKTWRSPPKPLGEAPAGFKDYQGARHDRVVAAYFYGVSKSGRHVWVVRCDCGNFETRAPSHWLSSKEKRREGIDQCEFCFDAELSLRGKSSGDTKLERQAKWIAGLQRLGLSVVEIGAVIRSNGSIVTKGRSVELIRADISRFTAQEDAVTW